MVSRFFHSAEGFHPGCRKVLLTDMSTDAAILGGGVRIERRQIRTDELIYERLLSQQQYLQKHDASGGIVFMDADMLLNGTLDKLFSRDFDVALTRRTSDEMPVNGGVIFVSQKNPRASLSFFDTFRKIFEERFSGAKRWNGDQQALAFLVENQPAMDFKLLLLPCEEYNYTPKNYYAEAVAGVLQTKKILHFKGLRKKYLEPFLRLKSGRAEPELSILVKEAGANSHVRKCVHSIYDHSPECYFEVLVADVPADEATREDLSTHFPNLLWTDGLGAARRAKGKRVLMLNTSQRFLGEKEAPVPLKGSS